MEIFINILIISFILYTVVGVTVLLFRVSENELKLKKYKKKLDRLQNTLSLYDNLEGNITPKQELLKG